MKQILKIGYTYLVLPESANLNALLKTLGQAKLAKHDYASDHKEIYVLEGSPVVEIKLAENDAVIDPNDRKRKAIPSKTGGPY